MMRCVQSTLPVGCRAAARSPRALTGTNCFDLECIDGQTRILYSSNGVSHDDISIPADPTQCFGLLPLLTPKPYLQFLNKLVTRPIASDQVVFLLAQWSVYSICSRWVAEPPRALLVRSRVQTVLTSSASTGKPQRPNG